MAISSISLGIQHTLGDKVNLGTRWGLNSWPTRLDLETVLYCRHSGSRLDCDCCSFPVLVPASALLGPHPRPIIPLPAAGQFPRSWRETDIMRNRSQDAFLFLDVHGCHASDSLETIFIITCHKREGSTLFASTCSSPDPMEVDQCLMWKVVIQDMTDAENV